jgi:ribosomal-protein-alanine N-acetyltransferase
MKENPRIKIRDYQPDDYPSLLELWEQCDLSQPERGDHPEVIDRCNKLGGRLLVMEEAGGKKIIGSSWMTWDGRRIYLHHFGILPEYQGKGLGTRLAEASLEWIREQGRQVKLEVHKENNQAKKLYEKLGFFAFRDYEIYMIRNLEK